MIFWRVERINPDKSLGSSDEKKKLQARGGGHSPPRGGAPTTEGVGAWSAAGEPHRRQRWCPQDAAGSPFSHAHTALPRPFPENTTSRLCPSDRQARVTLRPRVPGRSHPCQRWCRPRGPWVGATGGARVFPGPLAPAGPPSLPQHSARHPARDSSEATIQPWTGSHISRPQPPPQVTVSGPSQGRWCRGGAWAPSPIPLRPCSTPQSNRRPAPHTVCTCPCRLGWPDGLLLTPSQSPNTTSSAKPSLEASRPFLTPHPQTLV